MLKKTLRKHKKDVSLTQIGTPPNKKLIKQFSTHKFSNVSDTTSTPPGSHLGTLRKRPQRKKPSFIKPDTRTVRKQRFSTAQSMSTTREEFKDPFPQRFSVEFNLASDQEEETEKFKVKRGSLFSRTSAKGSQIERSRFSLQRTLKSAAKRIQRNTKLREERKRLKSVALEKEIIEKNKYVPPNLLKEEDLQHILVRFLQKYHRLELEENKRRKSFFLSDLAVYKSIAKKHIKEVNGQYDMLDEKLQIHYGVSLTTFYEELKEAEDYKVYQDDDDDDDYFVDVSIPNFNSSGISL
eukprot:snap_masked-scaffold_1-processed-gene-1.4-mRNA-1 protein AED:1.00 eAED:1.00 QI:0/-1/0/0/-1/1/1/0/294